MYKCLVCGHIFDEGEQATWTERHGLTTGPYEKWDGCPICRGGYARTKTCYKCGGEFLDDELYDRACLSCLKEAATYDMCFSYIKENDLLPDFMFKKVWNSDTPRFCSDVLTSVMRNYFCKMKAKDILSDSSEFISILHEYIFDDDGESGKQDFAEWMKEKGE